MYKLEKSLLTAIIAAAIATQGFAQTAKKPVNQTNTVKKASSSVTKPIAAPQVLKNGSDSLSAAIGVSFSNSLSSQGIENLNVDVLLTTIKSALKGGETVFNSESANEYIGQYFQKLQAEKGASVRQEGEAFLAANAKKDSIHTTESGLQYKVLTMGTGAKPLATDKVKTHYHGTLVDGTVFDSSVERGEPVEFPVNGVIKGWTEALQLMPVGSKFRLFVPYDLAYGERQAGPQIPGYSTLIFDVELLSIETEEPALEKLKDVKE